MVICFFASSFNFLGIPIALNQYLLVPNINKYLVVPRF